MGKIMILMIILLGGFAGAASAANQAASTTPAAVATASSTGAEVTAATPANVVTASVLQITPPLLDINAKASDVLEYTVVLTNNSPSHLSFYPVVNDLTAAGRMEFNDPTALDKTISLARWLRVSRGEIELDSGQSYEVPIRLEAAFNAKPGTYHAAITFSQASNMPDAKSLAKTDSQPTLLINAVIADESVEKAELAVFRADKNVFFRLPASFTLNIRNIGDTPVAPQGMVVIYDRKGREIDSVKVNAERTVVAASGEGKFGFSWKPASSKALGKYRAKVDIEYGVKSARDLSDTVYFWILPWPYLIILAGAVFFFVLAFSLALFRRTYVHPYHQIESEDNGVINLRK